MEQLFKYRFLDDVSLVPIEFAKYILAKLHQQVLLVVGHIAPCNLKTDDFGLVIDDKVQFEPIEPTCGSMPRLGNPLELPVLFYPLVLAYGELGRVDKGETSAFTHAIRAYKHDQWQGCQLLKLHEPVIGNQLGKL